MVNLTRAIMTPFNPKLININIRLCAEVLPDVRTEVDNNVESSIQRIVNNVVSWQDVITGDSA